MVSYLLPISGIDFLLPDLNNLSSLNSWSRHFSEESNDYLKLVAVVSSVDMINDFSIN
jgi:hypothetical protein